MAMRWQIFTIIGSTLLAFGIFFLIYAPTLPTYYAGGGTGTSVTGKIHNGLAPSDCEVLIITLPNTIHIHARSIENVTVTIDAPNGTTVAQWRNETVNQDYPATQCGLWHVTINQPSNYFVYGEVLATSPWYAHPALLYSAIPLLLGTMTLLYSVNKKKHAAYFQNVQFEQNIGGRWVFLAWVPILGAIAEAPTYIPSYPWLYTLLIIITVTAVYSSFALAYIKIYLSTKSLYIEAPFLNLHKHYNTNQIYGYAITQEKKQRLLGLWKIPSIRPKKEDQITISILTPLPKRLYIASFATRFKSNKIVFRPKSTEKFTTAAEQLGITKKETAEL
jgi:hypothetical protein